MMVMIFFMVVKILKLILKVPQIGVH